MATFKIVWEFTFNNGAGFNEVWYRDSDSILSAGLIPADVLNARLALLHPLNTFQRQRLSATTLPRATKAPVVRRVGTQVGTNHPLPAGAAFVCSISGKDGGSRRYWMRGGSLEDYTRDPKTGLDTPTSGWERVRGDFFTAMKAGGYGIRRLSGLNGNDIVYIQCTSVDGSRGDGTADLTLTDAPQLVVPARVIIGKMNKKDLPGLNGHFDVTKVVGKVITIPYQTPNKAIVALPGGRVRKEAYQATSVIDDGASGFDHLGTRTTRSPLSHSRGSKRAQRIRLLA